MVLRRMKKINLFLSLLFVLESYLICEEKKLEMEIYGTFDLPSFKGEYSYTYSPPFSPGAYLSSSELSLNYRTKNKNGFGSGINYFFSGNFGVRVEMNYWRAPLEGESSKYKIFLQYVSMLPPSYNPRLISYHTDMDWEPVEGDFRRFNTSVNLLYRLKMRNGIGAEIMAGFTHEISKLDLKSLGFTKFWLGGHSVLFGETYEIEFSSGSIKDFGLSGGGGLSIPLMEHLDLSFGFRYFHFPVRFASIELLEQENRGETIDRLDLDDLKAIKYLMKLPLIQFPHSHCSILASLRFKF